MFRGFLVFIFCLFISYNCTYATTIIVAQATTVIDDYNSIINPGDTLLLEGGLKSYLYLKNLHGSELNPIVIINNNDPMEINTTHYYGIKFDLCSHIKLSGNGNAEIPYGILISKVENGAGITVDNLSTNIEIEYVEISNTKIAGIYVKTEPRCDLSSNRENFTLYNFVMHDCYLHDIADEGMYIGSSKYTGQTNNDCGTLLPHVIEGVRIYNNIVENTGWDGIQVSSATKDCYIYNNVVRNDSYAEMQFQMSGIIIGGGSNCDCYNNKIFDGKGDGIEILGLGNHKIFNNLIVRAGASYKPLDGPSNLPKHGIWIGDVATDANAQMFIYNNTIISPKSFGIKIANSSISSYKIFNNLIVNPGFYSILQDNSFVNMPNGINFETSNYLYTNNISEVLFVGSSTDDFDLQATSPAVNTGLDLLSLGLSFDIENRTRPFAGFFDIGAYESQDNTIGIEEEKELLAKVIISNIIPNPISFKSSFHYEVTEPTHIRIFIVDQHGKLVEMMVDEYKYINSYELAIQSNKYETGLYFLIVESQFGRYSKKIIIL